MDVLGVGMVIGSLTTFLFLWLWVRSPVHSADAPARDTEPRIRAVQEAEQIILAKLK